MIKLADKVAKKGIVNILMSFKNKKLLGKKWKT